MSSEPFFGSVGLRMIAAVSKQGFASLKSGFFKASLALAIAYCALVLPVRAQFMYVTNWGDNTVSGYSIGTNGALTSVPGSPYSAGFQPESVAVDQAKFVYVLTSNPQKSVLGFSIGPDGALSALPTFPLTTDVNSNSVAVDPVGQFLFIPRADGQIIVCSILSDGALTPVPGSPFCIW